MSGNAKRRPRDGTGGVRGSPCRRHPCSWWHANLVDSYRAAVADQQARAEAATHGYATELDHYWTHTEQRLTFRQWLLGYREERTT